MPNLDRLCIPTQTKQKINQKRNHVRDFFWNSKASLRRQRLGRSNQTRLQAAIKIGNEDQLEIQLGSQQNFAKT